MPRQARLKLGESLEFPCATFQELDLQTRVTYLSYLSYPGHGQGYGTFSNRETVTKSQPGPAGCALDNRDT